MISMKTVLLTHSKRYPLMGIEDYIKLIYQSTFGPKHFSSNPTPATIRNYLVSELDHCQFYPGTPCLEEIGNGYVRVSLKAIIEGNITIDDLAESFSLSMNEQTASDEVLIKRFHAYADGWLELIEKGKLPLDYGESSRIFTHYVNEGISAMHHTPRYRLHYHPHYRVVHQDHLAL